MDSDQEHRNVTESIGWLKQQPGSKLTYKNSIGIEHHAPWRLCIFPVGIHSLQNFLVLSKQGSAFCICVRAEVYRNKQETIISACTAVVFAHDSECTKA